VIISLPPKDPSNDNEDGLFELNLNTMSHITVTNEEKSAGSSNSSLSPPPHLDPDHPDQFAMTRNISFMQRII
jgi:hypothetical protein